MTGQYSEAIPELREAVRRKPRNADYRAILGLTLTKDHQFPAGIRQSAIALLLRPWRAYFWEVLGLNLLYAFACWLFRLPKSS